MKLLTVAVATAALAAVTLSPVAAQSASAPAPAPAAARADEPPEEPVEPKPKWYPETGGFFNIPRSTYENQTIIESQIRAAIRRAKKGSFIRITIFSFDRMSMADELIRAKKRGVRVQILLNDHQFTPAMRRLRQALGTDRSKRSFSYVCSHGCRSRGENLHTKMVLFSRTGAAENVVMVGSFNLTFNSIGNQWNDMYVVHSAPRLYSAFLDLFWEMKRDKVAKPQYRVVNVTDKFQLRIMPRNRGRGPTTDPMWTILDKIRCKGAAKGTGNGKGRTLVRVSMHSWSDDRGAYLAKKMRTLYAAGCDVRLMYGMAGRTVRNELFKSTPRGRIPIHWNGYDTGTEDGLDSDIDLYSHHKYTVISGVWGKQKDANVVVTGSSNWNNDGAYGDELIFRVRGRSLVRQWLRNFAYIWDNGSRPVSYATGRAAPEQQLKAAGPAWEEG